ATESYTLSLHDALPICEGRRMEFGVWTKGLATLGVDCLVVGIFEEGELSGEARSVDAASSGALKRLLARGDFAGRAGDTLLIGRSEEHTSELQSPYDLV